VSKLLLLTIVLGALVASTHTSLWTPTAQPAPKRATCPQDWRPGDPGYFAYQLHYTKGHRATGGWGKWHCKPHPIYSWDDAR
jgi:hypothetical protein